MAQTTTSAAQAQPTGQAATIAQPEPVAQLPAARPRTGGIMAIVPTSWQEVVAISGAICRANMAPKSYCKVDGYGKMVYVDGKPVPEPEKVAIGIMHGLELGFTPMAALQSIAVINGMPSVYGDGMLAIVRASGLLEDFQETMEWDDKGPVKALCRVKRRNEASWGEMDCARLDAQKAGWWEKAGPWTLTPHRMLQMRARGWALRDKFADVLRGLHSAEEMEDMVDVTPKGSATVAEPAEPAPKRENFTEKPKESAPPAETKKEEKAATEKKSRASRSKKTGVSPSATPHTGSGESGQQEPPAAGGVPTASSGQPVVTDVVDENAPIEFPEFARATEFLDFSSKWMAEANRTPAQARQWEEKFRTQIDTCGKSDIKRIKDGIVDVLAVYGEVLARESAREPGQEG